MSAPFLVRGAGLLAASTGRRRAEPDSKMARAGRGRPRRKCTGRGRLWLAELQKDLAGRESRSAALRRLANVATGSEPRNPGFHRFVLAERLDEVLLAANRRLGPMSDERYRLQRVRDEENRRVGRSPDPT